MKKRVLSLALTFLMLLGLLPPAALAADEATTTWLTNNQLSVGETLVTADNADAILSGENQGKASFAVVDNVPTLTLKGANITTPYSVGGANAGISSSAALTIQLEGNNTVAFDVGDSMAVGISTGGDLTITGSGSLKVSVASTSPMCFAVMAQESTLTVDGSMTIQGSMATGEDINLEEAEVVNIEGSGASIYLKSDQAAPAKTVLIQPLPPHSHPLCGETCSHGDSHSAVEYKPLSQSDFDNAKNASNTLFNGVLNRNDLFYELSNGNYYLNGDITLDKQIQFPADATVNLCLNGHKLQFENVSDGVFVGQSNTFGICDCQSTGKVTNQKGGLTVNGTVDLYGGTITSGDDYGIKLNAGATATITGGGVESTDSIAVYNTGGTVNISGGSLKSVNICLNNDQSFDDSGNTTPGTATVSGGSITGVACGIQNYSKLTVTGGTITATGSTPDCYGICNANSVTSDATLTLTGNPAISGTTAALELYTSAGTAVAYAKVDATGYTGNELTVTENSPSEGAYAIKVSDGSKDKFTLSDSSGYQYVYQDGGLMLHKHTLTKTAAVAATCTTAGNNAYWTCSGCHKIYSDQAATTETTVADMTIAALEHDYTYAASGDTITQTCSRDNSHTHTLTINAPADLTYDGAAKEATLSGSLDGVTPGDITYSGGGEALSGAPINAGSYTANVTAGGKTAGVDFTITKAAQEAPSVTISADEQTTDSITLHVSGEDSGKLFQYSKDGGTTWQNGATFTDLTPGTAYEFTVRLAGDDNHDPSSPSAAVTIYTVPAAPADDGTGLVYDYEAETVKAAEGYELSTDGGRMWTSDPVNLDLDGTPPTVQVRKAESTADGVTVPAGAAATVTLPGRPAAPEGVEAVDETVTGLRDGKITGVTTAMEYSADNGATWTPCAGTELTGLAPGAYQVRTKATDSAFAGEPTTVTVAQGAAHTYALQVTAPTFDQVYEGYDQPEAKAITIQNNGNSEAAITAVEVSGDAFAIGGSGESVPAGESIDTWTVRPNPGLPAGVHTATITVTHDGGETSQGSVTFTVNALTHDWTWEITTEPTLDGPGEANHTCPGDERHAAHTETGVEIPALSDTDVWTEDETQRVEPTETTPGSKTYTSAYGEVTVSIPATGAAPTYAISGKVTENGTGVADITVILWKGNEMVAYLTTQEDGTYTFTDVPSGHYNVVARKDEDSGLLRTVTILVTVADADATEQNLVFPADNVNSVLVVDENTPAVVVGGLEVEANEVKKDYPDADSVTVMMTVRSMTADHAANAADIQAAAAGKALEYMDITINRQIVTNETFTSEYMTETTVPMTIIIPFDPAGKEDITAYRYHTAAIGDAGQVDTLTTTAVDGEYFTVGADNITLHVKKFSTYAIGYTETPDPVVPPPSYSGDGVTYYTITASAGEGGKIDPGGKVSVRRGRDKSFTITPNEGYVVDDVLVDGESVGAVDAYTFEKVAKAHTIEAAFRQVDNLADCPKDETCPIHPFIDANADAWYHDGVHFCLEKGLMVGTSETTFEPETDTDRATIATVLWRLQGGQVVDYAMEYDDVAEGAWYTEAVRWAASEGIVEGYGNGSFGPDDPITREQLATMLYRYEQKFGGGGFTGMWMFLLDFADAAQVSDWADEAMHWMTMNKVITGKGENLLDPQGTATRAETAAMLWRYLQTAEK